MKTRMIVAAALAVPSSLVGCGGPGGDAVSGAGPGTFVPNGPAHSAALWAAGDGADGGRAAKAVARLVAGRHPDVFLYLGDVYPWGDARAFARNYVPTYGRLASITAPTPGNHDWPIHDQGYDAYWARVRGARTPRYYSFRAGGWQILGLNSEIGAGRGSSQLRWLRRQLRAPGTCRLAFWHRPRFSAGVVHGDNRHVDPLWRALLGHARLVLSGHEHDMQRMRARDGLVELVDGAGGHGHYGLHRRYRGLAFGDRVHFGAIRIGLRPGIARVAFVDTAGRVLDRTRVRCSGSGV